jgi:hypothetical protein
MEVFLARHAGVGLIDPIAASGIQVTPPAKRRELRRSQFIQSCGVKTVLGMVFLERFE